MFRILNDWYTSLQIKFARWLAKYAIELVDDKYSLNLSKNQIEDLIIEVAKNPHIHTEDVVFNYLSVVENK